jgi:hypothetical protein
VEDVLRFVTVGLDPDEYELTVYEREERVKARAADVFDSMDENGTGLATFEDFKRCVFEFPYLVEGFLQPLADASAPLAVTSSPGGESS